MLDGIHPSALFDLDEWRRRSFELSMRFILLVQIPIFGYFLVYYHGKGAIERAWFMVPLLLTQLFAGFAGTVSYRIRAWVQLLCMFTVGTAMLVNGGLLAGTAMVFLTTICFAIVFLGWRHASVFLGLFVADLVAVGWGYLSGRLERNPEIPIDASLPGAWLDTGFTVLLLMVLVILAMGYLIRGMERTVVSSQELVSRLRKEARHREQVMQKLETTRLQLDHAQRMEALSQLAAGFVHDLNNTLTVILGQAELLRMKGAEEKVEAICDAALHAASFTKQLLGLARHRVSHAQTLDLSATLPTIMKTVRRALPSDIELHVDVEPGLAVRMDPAHLQQILLNLVLNAREAMPQGGNLTLECGLARGSGEREGQYARLVLTDDGTGMDEQTLQRACEPLFTTRELGRGTGLGLFNVKTLVEEQAGILYISSKPGRGTRVEIRLPLTADVPATEPRRPAPADLRGDGERVLVVDDDVRVGEVVVRQLTEAGYLASMVAGVRPALSILQDEAVDLVITDVVMPEGGGAGLIRWIKERTPGVKVVVCSGYTHDETVRHGVQAEEYPFVQKPFKGTELLEVVRRELTTA